MFNELCVFDFDGTLFRSPNPHPDNNTPSTPNFIEEVINNFDDGLGWYQHIATLDPPFVPEKPSFDVKNDAECWYVPSMINHFHRAKANPNAFVVVMTGREEYFRERIEQLLKHARLEPHKVYLKESLQIGTMNSKMRNIARLVSNAEESDGGIRPGSIRNVTLYEDREHHAERFKKNLALLSSHVPSAPTKTAEEKEITTQKNARTDGGPRWLEALDRASIPIGVLGFEFSIVMPMEGERIVTHLPTDVENHLLHILLESKYAKAEALEPKCDCSIQGFSTSTKLKDVTRSNIRTLIHNMSMPIHPDIEWNIHGSLTSSDIDVIVALRDKKLTLISIDDTRKLEDKYSIAIRKILKNVDPRQVDVNLAELSAFGTIIACSKGTPSKVNNALLETYDLHRDLQRHACFVKQHCVRNRFKDSLASSHYIFTSLARTAAGCSNCRAEGKIMGCSACNMYPEINRKARFSAVEMLHFFLKMDMTAFVFFNCKRARVCDVLKSVVFQLCQSISFLDSGAELFTKEAVIDVYPQMAPFIQRKVHNTSNKPLFYQLGILKDLFCNRLLDLLQQDELNLLPAYAFELSEKHQRDVAMVLREGYDVYLECCSQRTLDIVARSPYSYTNAKNQRKYLLNNNVQCVTIHTVLSGTHEVKIAIPLEDKQE